MLADNEFPQAHRTHVLYHSDREASFARFCHFSLPTSCRQTMPSERKAVFATIARWKVATPIGGVYIRVERCELLSFGGGRM